MPDNADPVRPYAEQKFHRMVRLAVREAKRASDDDSPHVLLEALRQRGYEVRVIDGSDDTKCFSSEGICPTHGVTHLDDSKERAAEVRKYGVRELARRARANLYGDHTDGHADPS